MYTPPAFAESGPETLHALMRENSFAILVSATADGPLITHLPLLLDPDEAENGVLWGHMARANPHWKAMETEPAAVAVFSGPHAYVSPRWYETQPSVPTWNYVAVHVRGRVETIHDAAALEPLVEKMTAEYEAGDGAWHFADTPEDFRQRQLKGIVGFRMTIDRLEGKLKLSQNRPPADAERVAAALDWKAGEGREALEGREGAESRATAAAMRRFGVVDADPG